MHLPINAGDVGLILGWRRSSGVGNSNLLQDSSLETLKDRKASWTTVHGHPHTHTHTHTQCETSTSLKIQGPSGVGAPLPSLTEDAHNRKLGRIQTSAVLSLRRHHSLLRHEHWGLVFEDLPQQHKSIPFNIVVFKIKCPGPFKFYILIQNVFIQLWETVQHNGFGVSLGLDYGTPQLEGPIPLLTG